MPDARKHRGPAPGDADRFAAAVLPPLRGAVGDLSWLLGRGYAEPSSLALVGDRYALGKRQREAVRRASCGEADARSRLRRRVDAIAGATVAVDGFNQIIVCESLLSGAPVFVGRDGAHRDLASVHGTWRRVRETGAALGALADALAGAAAVRWLLDRPVSNSGRLRALIEAEACDRQLPWSVELLADPDAALAERGHVAATGDAWILDRCEAWIDLPGLVAASQPEPWIVDLREPPSDGA